MSTLTQSLTEPATVQSGRSFRTGNAMDYKAWIANAPKQPMVLETVDLGPLAAEDVEVAVEYCGLCHSDLSILNNEWGISQYPAILGHEVIGRVTAVGPNAKGLKVGQRVGVGWNSGSCMHCHQCMSGSHHLCPQVQATIVGHRGGFATHVRATGLGPFRCRKNWTSQKPGRSCAEELRSFRRWPCSPSRPTG